MVISPHLAQRAQTPQKIIAKTIHLVHSTAPLQAKLRVVNCSCSTVIYDHVGSSAQSVSPLQLLTRSVLKHQEAEH